MERRDEADARGVRVAAVGLAATVVLTLLTGALAASHGSFVIAGVAAHLIASVPIWIAVLAHEVRREQARAARVEARRLSALSREGRRPIFQDGALDADVAHAAERGDASVANDRLRRGGASLAAVSAAALELATAWGLFTVFPLEGARASLPAAAALCGGAFGLLVVGRYAAALARGAGLTEVAAGGRRAASGALFLLTGGLLLAAAHAGAWARLDLAGHIFAVVAALLGVEGLLLLLLELYRPRRPGEEQRPVYDSRLLGLVSAPADLARSIARTVDYQFGFAISQTWFYRFLERWVAPIVAFALLVLWALSSVVVVQPHERALVRRLGLLRAGVLLEPGASLKLPWPIDEAIHVPQARVQSFITGGHEVNQTVDGTRERTVLWTEAHKRDEDEHGDEHSDDAEDSDLLVLLARRGAGEAGDSTAAVNLLATAATITFRVRDAVAFTTGVEDARGLLEALAERELSFMLSGADLDELLVSRGARAMELRARVQAAADAHGLGVEVTAAHLTELHPPPEVGPSFEAVTSALERKEAVILAARAHEHRVAPAAQAEADRLRRAAIVAARGRVALVEADAERFLAQRLLDRAAPGVFRMDLLLRALVESSREARKIVVGAPGAEVVTDLDLSEKITAEQLNLGAGFDSAPASTSGQPGDGK